MTAENDDTTSQQHADDAGNAKASAREAELTCDGISNAQNTTGSADPLTQYLAVFELSSGWVKNLSALALLEFTRSARAVKRSIALQFALVPMVLTLYLSFCATLAVVAYQEFGSIYAALGIFIAAQCFFIFATLKYIDRMKSVFGFKHTTTQLKEIKHELASAFR